jgi:inorganic pyrophosphatase
MGASNPTMPRRFRVTIEVSKGSHVKRGSRGEIDFLSPVSCPWNYGSAIGYLGADGDPVDVVLLGPRLERGTVLEVELQGRIPFVDEGEQDDKWIAAEEPLSPELVAEVEAFFQRYARAKKWASRLRMRNLETSVRSYIAWSSTSP